MGVPASPSVSGSKSAVGSRVAAKLQKELPSVALLQQRPHRLPSLRAFRLRPHALDGKLPTIKGEAVKRGCVFILQTS